MTSSCTLSSSSNFFSARYFFRWISKVEITGREVRTVRRMVQYIPLHLLPWEIIWRNAPRIWWHFGSALSFKTRLTQTKPVLPLLNEHGSQVKDQGRRQCYNNKQNKIPYRLTRDVSLLSGLASYDFVNLPWEELNNISLTISTDLIMLDNYNVIGLFSLDLECMRKFGECTLCKL